MSIETGVLTPREPAIDIVRIISEGTYTSFAQALKEFISNAYDADATEVNITVDDDCNGIAIRDNGVGMSLRDFGDFFASIARSGKSAARTTYGRTKFGRVKIGRFGIGALAVAGIAKKLIIRSKKAYSNEGFESWIDLEKVRTQFLKGENLSKHWKFSYKRWEGEPYGIHYTEIQIEGINDEIKSNLLRPGAKTITEFFESSSLLSGLDELAWQLGVISPVSYIQGYPIPEKYLSRSHDKIIFDRSRKLLKDNFRILLNGRPLKKPIYFPNYDPSKLGDAKSGELLLKRGLGFDIEYLRSPKQSPIHLEGYVVIQAAKLYPEELRGVLIRLRGVAIGWHRTLNLGGEVLSTMMPNLSGEVWVDGLEDALQFDRESFREDHPKFQVLRKIIINAIRKEEKGFRNRSAKRTEELKKNKSGTKSKIRSVPTSSEKHIDGESFLPPSIFERMPDYVTRIVPQINGCWDRQYYEASAVMIRRLIETLIIEMYFRKKWDNELKDPKTKDYIRLKLMIDKVCGDSRFGLDSRIQGGLKQMKEIGDIAAHDFRIRIKKSDLQNIKDNLRYTLERLVYKINGTGP